MVCDGVQFWRHPIEMEAGNGDNMMGACGADVDVNAQTSGTEFVQGLSSICLQAWELSGNASTRRCLF